MEAVLAEFKAEELGQDVEEDIDFIMGKGKSKSHYLLTSYILYILIHQYHWKDEEDAFESDFASTDEEGAQEDVDEAAEKLATEEEKGVRRVCFIPFHPL